MLFTSTLDRDWNDLSIHPGYLPLMQEIVRFLARKQDRRARAPVLVGRDAVLSVGPDDTRIEVVAPSGARAVIEGDGLAGRKQVRFGQTAEPGLYRVQAKDAAGHDRRRPESDFAVNVNVRGSDIRSASPTALPATEGSDATIGPASHERSVELWHAVAVGLLILLLLESMLVLR
jgi:hypothetical protein